MFSMVNRYEKYIALALNMPTTGTRERSKASVRIYIYRIRQGTYCSIAEEVLPAILRAGKSNIPNS